MFLFLVMCNTGSQMKITLMFPLFRLRTVQVGKKFSAYCGTGGLLLHSQEPVTGTCSEEVNIAYTHTNLSL